jgi:hypothetical protein
MDKALFMGANNNLVFSVINQQLNLGVMDMKRRSNDDQKHQELTKRLRIISLPCWFIGIKRNMLTGHRLFTMVWQNPRKWIKCPCENFLALCIKKKNLPHIKRVLTGETQF